MSTSYDTASAIPPPATIVPAFASPENTSTSAVSSSHRPADEEAILNDRDQVISTPKGTLNDEEECVVTPQNVNEEHHAYFRYSYDAIFGIVFRPAFEERLRQHLESNLPDDPSWLAMRSTIYASGCMALLSKDPSVAFEDVHRTAWRYFENAISVHTELLIAPTGLAGVQALALMSYFVEGLGNPALEYTFCSSAVRLAQAKGLHRQPAKSWKLPEAEILHRNWLWWAIYCSDKSIARRSGRPSAIDDEEISCEIPSKKVDGSTMDLDFFTYAIRHAQLSSQISHQLLSAKALRFGPTSLIDRVKNMLQRLEMLQRTLPAHLKIDSAKGNALSPSAIRYDHIMYLHDAYYGSLMAIHSLFSYPWIWLLDNMENNVAVQSQMAASSVALAEAARNIILASRVLEINPSSPHWLAFSYPMFALINLFICVLKSPTAPSSNSSLALLDMAAGHFGHMEFITTSELSFPFAREAASLARKVVKAAAQSMSENTDESSGTINRDVIPLGLDLEPFGNPNDLDMIDLDIESWGVFGFSGEPF
ncbi:hypothetical protein N7520_011694 [Penicillium odoratum]|uniref:uncharacterized protein n=1 Tax=Penicillium odoratum TaxID=1167516 RepID=UPI0025468E33|nr:uncharacterized protein N7520_011694 [Penicillium odoratum]KAJ5746512.1 hypothetical protein N7520_011694 [Penicillium odoratum]